MGNKEEGKSSKTDKLSSPTLPDQTNIHMYPDWAAMQAYYSPTVPLPPYYFSAMPSGHPPHPYMWGPRPMMPPYGSPYAALRNTHEGVYARPAASLVSRYSYYFIVMICSYGNNSRNSTLVRTSTVISCFLVSKFEVQLNVVTLPASSKYEWMIPGIFWNTD